MLAPAVFFANPTADLLVVLAIVLLFLGPKRLPGLGRSLGSGIREFKEGLSSSSDSSEEKKPDEVGAGESGSAS